MNKVALKEIGFVEQNDVDDEWAQTNPSQDMDRDLGPSYLVNGHWFKSIDQAQASLTEDLAMDENGSSYHQQVRFAVRTQADRDLAKKYERRPIVLHVWTVDGHLYKIGTKSYPARLKTSKTNSRNTVETEVTVEYDTLAPLM